MNLVRRISLTSTLTAGLLLSLPSLAFADTTVPVITDVSVVGSDVSVSFTNDVADVTSIDVVLYDDSNTVVTTDTLDSSQTSDTLSGIGAGNGYTVQIVDHTTTGDVVSLLSDPFAVPAIDPIPSTVDPSSASVSLNGDATAWVVTFSPLVTDVVGATYVVTSSDGSSCTAIWADAATSDVSCELPLLDDPSQVPSISSIFEVIVPTMYSNHPPQSVDLATATIALNADGTGWTVSWPEVATEGAVLPYVAITVEGTSCDVLGSGVEGNVISCDLPLLDDPAQQPTLESISTIGIMYDARGGVRNDFGVTTTTTASPEAVAYQSLSDSPVTTATKHAIAVESKSSTALTLGIVLLSLVVIGAALAGSANYLRRRSNS